jgi:hypothetical protein
MFLIPRAKWKPYEDVWFAKSLMGKHALSLITSALIIDLGLIDKKITNKMGKGIGIRHMED